MFHSSRHPLPLIIINSKLKHTLNLIVKIIGFAGQTSSVDASGKFSVTLSSTAITVDAETSKDVKPARLLNSVNFAFERDAFKVKENVDMYGGNRVAQISNNKTCVYLLHRRIGFPLIASIISS